MPSPSSTIADARDLQELVRLSDLHPKRRRQAMSRAGRLSQIDRLSRWSATGLAVIAGASIYAAVVAGQLTPFRSAVWILLVLAGVWTCRKYQANYRTGDVICARPFRWRANYTACLSVLGVAFGCGAVLLVDDSTSSFFVLQIIAMTLAGSTISGIAHAAHPPSVISIVLPPVIFCFAAAAKGGLTGYMLYGVIAGVVFCIATTAFAAAAMDFEARRRHPRTTFLRGEVADYGASRYRGTEPNAIIASPADAIAQ